MSLMAYGKISVSGVKLGYCLGNPYASKKLFEERLGLRFLCHSYDNMGCGVFKQGVQN